MGAELDRLEVQVEAQATRANNQLDKLVNKLDRVSSALSNLNSGGLTGLSNGVAKFAQASAQLSNVKTADFTRLTKNIQSLANLNTQQIYNVASSMRTLSTAINGLGGVSSSSLQVVQVANSISKLGGANVQRAIVNLPALANAMNNLMATLSKAPAVSNNVINLTRALANLASQGSKVGTAGNTLTNSITRVGTSMEKTTKKARSFSSVIGSIYQKYFLVMRAGSKLWDSIKESMDYVEVLNYFDAGFGQVAESAVSQWEEAGCDSAQAYYNSFSERAKQLTTKMTGFTITESGMLESTGGKSLGINPSQLMKYQAMFAQMSNSMGVAAETSLKLSTALTEIGADLASVKNMDFDKVWTDMASGLAGMSRTLDKYGANIRNVNLQQKLTELGINANITALNQNEKALLRTIILLDSTRYAWGDLAETIDQPANQLRLLQANFVNLARTIGNIFLPIVAKMLPYLNAVVIALQRLAEWIVKLLGFEDFDWGGSGGTGDGGFSDLIGGIGDAEDGLNSATEAAERLKTHLLGIDELNVVNNDEDSSSSIVGGIGGYGGLLEGALDKILDEYQKAWDEAFANMEARFEDFANKIAEIYKEKGLFGVGEYFSQLMTNALNNIPWESIYEGARIFGTGLAEFLNGLITPELFGAVGKTIAGALNTAIYAALSFGEEFDFYDFGVSIATGINEFFATFDFTSLSQTLNTWVDGIWNLLSGFFLTLDWGIIIKGVGNFLGNLEGDTIATLIGIANLKKLGKAISNLIGSNIGGDLGKVSENGTAMFGTAEGVSGLALAFEGLNTAIQAVVATAEGLIILDIIKEPIIDMLGSMAENEEKAKQLKESYDGLLGTICLVRDSLVPITSLFNGLPTVMGGSANASLAMSEALDKIGNGTVYTDEQMRKMQKTWSLLDDDMETLRQAMIDTNPEVFEMTKSFESLDDASFETLEDAANGLKLIAEGSIDAKDAFDEFRKPMWDMTEEALEFFETFKNGEEDLKNFSDSMSKIGTNITDGLSEGVLNADTDKPSKSIFEKFVDSIKNIFGIHSPAENMKPIGENIFLGIVEGFGSMFESFTNKMTEFWELYISPWFTLEKWSELGNGILEGLQLKWDEIVVWWQESAMFEWWENDVSPWFSVEKWNTMLNNINTSFVTKWNENVNQWKTNIKKWWDEHVAPWFTKQRWLTLGENLKNGIFEGFKGLANKVVDVLNNVISALENMINNAIAGINDLLAKVNESGLGESLGLELHIGNISFGRIPRFAQGGIVDRPTLGIFGEQGREAIIPLERNTEWIDSIAEQINNSGNNYSEELLREQNALLREQNELLSYLADKEIVASIDPTRETIRGLREAEMRYGFSFT